MVINSMSLQRGMGFGNKISNPYVFGNVDEEKVGKEVLRLAAKGAEMQSNNVPDYEFVGDYSNYQRVYRERAKLFTELASSKSEKDREILKEIGKQVKVYA